MLTKIFFFNLPERTSLKFFLEEKSGEKKDHEVQWVVDNNFNKELERLKVPQGKLFL